MLSLAHRRRSITTLAALLVGCAFVGSVPTTQQTAERDLIVFVGKRLSVKQQTAEPDSLDQKFEARYRVLQLGDYLYRIRPLRYSALRSVRHGFDVRQ
jgi:hypothetical protein